MVETIKPSAKSLRKLRRRIENEAYAKDARFWRNPRSAERIGYTRPIDRQAAKELSHKAGKKRR
jgi:DNA-binding FadR family transcriptional regulator